MYLPRGPTAPKLDPETIALHFKPHALALFLEIKALFIGKGLKEIKKALHLQLTLKIHQ